eukprot:1721479-Rhodomonas_salina.1
MSWQSRACARRNLSAACRPGSRTDRINTSAPEMAAPSSLTSCSHLTANATPKQQQNTVA